MEEEEEEEGGECVTVIISSDPTVSLGLCCRRDEECLPRHVRRLGDALIHSDRNSKKRQQSTTTISSPSTRLLARDAASLWANQ